MSELRELYQELIIDHGRTPRNFSVLDHPTHEHEGFNPLCGDKIKLYLREENNKIIDASFQGCGCAISTASASMMTEAVKGKTLEEVKAMFSNFQELVTGKADANTEEHLGKLRVLSGVAEYPSRVKCAILCWHTLAAALENESEVVRTE